MVPCGASEEVLIGSGVAVSVSTLLMPCLRVHSLARSRALAGCGSLMHAYTRARKPVFNHVTAEGANVIGGAGDGLHQPAVRVKEFADDVVLRQDRHSAIVRSLMLLAALFGVPVEVLGQGLVGPWRIEGNGGGVDHDRHDVCNPSSQRVPCNH